MFRATIKTFTICLACLIPFGAARSQTITLPLTPAEWSATDTIKFESFLGRPAVYINSGVAMSRTANFRNGTIDFDIAANDRSGNMGFAFRAQRSDMSEVLFFRAGVTDLSQAMQYAPALNSIPGAWQIYHGTGATSAVEVPRNKWFHVRIVVAADSAIIYVHDNPKPVMIVPHLFLGGNGTGLALWGSGFGRGIYYSNISYTPDNATYSSKAWPLPVGTIADWQLSPAFDGATLTPGKLPNLATMKWESVRAEAPGLVLVNRYRKTPNIIAPSDQDTVLHNRFAGSKVVYARTFIDSPTARTRLMHFGYSDNVVIYLNGAPVFMGINPSGFRDGDLGLFNPLGDAVFLSLKKGRNEIVFAVTEYFGGWAFSARLEETS